jgi:beta-glucosidase-like glycosyl hydrolase
MRSLALSDDPVLTGRMAVAFVASPRMDRRTLREVLKQERGFAGPVMSDWQATKDDRGVGARRAGPRHARAGRSLG